MVFHWSLTNHKSPHVSRNLLRILADFNNGRIVSIRPLIYNSFSSPYQTFVAFVREHIWHKVLLRLPMGITIILIFHSFLSSLPRYKYLSLLLLSWFSLRRLLGRQSLLYSKFSFFFFFFLIISSPNLYSLIMWLILSSRSSHNLYLLFDLVLSIFALI